MPLIDMPLDELREDSELNPRPAEACNRMSCPKSLAIFPDFGREGLPGINDMVCEYLAAL